MSDVDLRVLMGGLGKTQSDLARLVGSRSRASEYLNGKRCVPLGERRNLMSQWGISAHEAIMLPIKLSDDLHNPPLNNDTTHGGDNE